MIPAWILVLAVVVLGAGAAYNIRIQEQVEDVTKPVIWWHVDDLPDTKQWRSFEDRRLPHGTPYLTVCLRKAQQLWGEDFTIIPVMGRADALERIRAAGGAIPEWVAEASPVLWIMWVRPAMLAALGGFWVDGSVLPVASGLELRRRTVKDAVCFESAGWAARPRHPMWVAQAATMSMLIDRGPQSWSEVDMRQIRQSIPEERADVIKPCGSRLNYEDLFEKSAWYPPMGLWVALPDGRDRMEMASKTLWFTRLSEAQIHESDFLWASYARL
jgi:hypothetical protein